MGSTAQQIRDLLLQSELSAFGSALRRSTHPYKWMGSGPVTEKS